jgi:hypothetical protein
MPASILRLGKGRFIFLPTTSSDLKPVIFSEAGLNEIMFFLLSTIIPEGISSKIFLYNTDNWSYFKVVLINSFSVLSNRPESRELKMAVMKKVSPWIEKKFSADRMSPRGLYQ